MWTVNSRNSGEDEMKKNLLTVLILALLIVNIVLTSVMLISIVGVNAKTGALVGNIGAVLNLELTEPGEETQEEVVSALDLEEVDLGEVTIMLKPDVIEPDATAAATEPSTTAKSAYMVFNVALQLNTTSPDYEEINGEFITGKKNLIISTINDVVGTHTLEECKGNQPALKAEIKQALRNLLQSDVVYEISLSEVKFG
jgi:flagellar FliL protein